jgi:spermidine/putrescine transport system substrate-binding protein
MTRLLAFLLCLLAAPAAAQTGLTLYAWPNAVPGELLERYRADSGVAVRLEIYDYDADRPLAEELRRRAGQIDLFLASGRQVQALVAEGLAAELNAVELPNFGEVPPPFDAPPFDPQRRWSAPYTWGTTGFTYDREKLGTELADSWSEIFEPRIEALGRIAMLNDPVGVYEAAAYYLGFDPCTTDEAESETILQLLANQKPHVVAYASDGTVARLISGEAWLHHQWNGAAHRTKARLPSAVYVVPVEGATMWTDNLMLAADAPSPEAARAFVDWLLTPRAAALVSNQTGYMTAVEGARRHMDRRLLDDPAVALPAEKLDRLRPERVCPPEAADMRASVWRRLNPHEESERQ